MTHFKTDPNLMADIKGYPGNDNQHDPDIEDLASEPTRHLLRVDGSVRDSL